MDDGERRCAVERCAPVDDRLRTSTAVEQFQGERAITCFPRQYVRSKGVRAAYFFVDVTRDRRDRISAMVECGTLDLPVGEVLDLADAGTAHRMLGGAPHRPGKIVLQVAD